MEHKVNRIIRQGCLAGDILGLEVERKGKKMNFKARRGVVLASGGFGHDYKMLYIHNPLITNEIPSSNHPGATGEILMQAQDVGAYLVGMDFIQIHPSLGARKPGRFSTTRATTAWSNRRDAFVGRGRRDVRSIQLQATGQVILADLDRWDERLRVRMRSSRRM
jgi:succinate dehydrogenase/fumarate reductase flavoprotein subunit